MDELPLLVAGIDSMVILTCPPSPLIRPLEDPSTAIATRSSASRKQNISKNILQSRTNVSAVSANLVVSNGHTESYSES